MLAASERVLLPCADGVRLTADVALNGDAPLVILIHGWLGNSLSGYLLSSAADLFDRGYSVARLHLRDHGNSEHLNAEMFHSARIDEVVDACNWLARVYGDRGLGLVGFSLGGNFALRVTAHTRRTDTLRATIAVCPVIEPGPTMQAIDSGWFGYRFYFVRKWHRALVAKQRAFPQRFSLSEALSLDRVSSLTDYFVEHHTPYLSSQDYFDAYRIDAPCIEAIRTQTHILAAADDPVIPAHTLSNLPANPNVRLEMASHGGHCAFLADYGLRSAADEHIRAVLATAGLTPSLPSR